MAHRRANKRKIKRSERLEAFRHQVARDRESLFATEPRNKALEQWGADIVRRDIEEELAADRRQREENSWPVNDYVLGAALMLIGAIVLIAIALATGLVKP